MVLVTHYQRLLNYIVPDYVHVMEAGRIVKTGGKELALELEARGYDWVGAGGSVTHELHEYRAQQRAMSRAICCWATDRQCGYLAEADARRSAVDRLGALNLPTTRRRGLALHRYSAADQASFQPVRLRCRLVALADYRAACSYPKPRCGWSSSTEAMRRSFPTWNRRRRGHRGIAA